MIFDKLEFPRFADIENMFDRTISISSAGKTFTCTGWKVGWAIASEKIIKAMSVI